MSLKLHPRTTITMTVGAEFDVFLLELQKKYDLTDVEILQMLTAGQQGILKFMLRAERHPDDPTKRADEE